MIHIEGEDNMLDEDEELTMSHQLKAFLEDLK